MTGDTPSAGRHSSVPPATAYAAALAGLPGIGPAGLAGLIRGHDPETVWHGVLAGEVRRPEPAPGRRPGGPRPAWQAVARRVDVARRWSALVAGGIGVTYFGATDYPAALAADPEPPGVLFWRGDLGALDRRCIAVVGTRRCTHYGRDVAFSMGRDLAASGICVVSGLALGIDGAAHAGALAVAGGPGSVGVAASGVDVPYPRRHAGLWERVIDTGAVISETAPGQPAQAWRFPARNRIIAGLVAAVVVVESHAGGGSMLTVEAAMLRDVEIMAVPGPVHSPASAGTNQLLVLGPRPVRHAGDVLDALGDVRPWPPPAQLGLVAAGPPEPAQARPGRLDPASTRILASVDWTPTGPGIIAERTGLAIGPLSVGLRRLESMGLVRDGGGWWERVAGSDGGVHSRRDAGR